jgi:hypothetical protein
MVPITTKQQHDDGCETTIEMAVLQYRRVIQLEELFYPLLVDSNTCSKPLVPYYNNDPAANTICRQSQGCLP